MASFSDNISMAVFCDFENVALGVRDANYEKFDIKPVLERLLLKGSIVVKKSYCDWDRYKGFKATMHEANFELIEIPHVRQSGKNSADIRMVVDALDLCYTKSHVNTFVIVSGDSDFSPLVSKLRENAKRVIGVGVKQSTSDLLVANCDEFIFYDDLVREQRRAAAKRDERKAQPQQGRRPSDENNRKREEMESRKLQALEMVVETFDALVSERGDTGKIWASLLKDTLKRRRPDFSETYYGFRTFGNLLEEAQTRGLFEFGRDEKSGTYVYRGANAQPDLQAVEPAADVAGDVTNEADNQAANEPANEAANETAVPEIGRQRGAPDAVDEPGAEVQGEQPTEVPAAARESRRRGGRGRKGREGQASVAEAAPVAAATWLAPTPDLAEVPEAADGAGTAETIATVEPAPPVEAAPAVTEEAAAPAKERRRATRTPRTPRKPAARKGAAAAADTGADAATGTNAAADAGAAAGTAVTPDVAAQDAAAVRGAGADAHPPEAQPEPAGVEGEGEADDKSGKAARKKSARPAHKAPSRKASTRAPRRPAKGKTPQENG